MSAFAQQRLLKTDNLTEIEISNEQEITVNNLAGYEIVAEGKDLKTGELVTLYQVILLDSDSYYYLMQGQVSTSLNEQYLSQFEELARSFTIK